MEKVEEIGHMCKETCMNGKTGCDGRKKTWTYLSFGVQVPHNESEPRELDKKYIEKGQEPKWRNAEKKEIDQLNEYETFKDNGKNAPPKCYIVNSPEQRKAPS